MEPVPMAVFDALGIDLPFRYGLIIGAITAALATLYITPKAIYKLRSAGIVGRDRHKPGMPEVPEMGGLAVFVAYNMGAFATIALSHIRNQELVLVLASLVVIAGAALTGVIDDLVTLRQRFKAIIPFAFAAPLALFVDDTTVWLPLVGNTDFGIVYAAILVPLGVACASNGFNMLEGFNGLGAGLGLIMATAMAALIILAGDYTGLALVGPLIGALAAFLVFNWYPAKVFPGDTMTLMVGSVLATAAVVGKVEFWGAILFVPHIVEFMIKAKNGFPTSQWGGRLLADGNLAAERDKPVGIAQSVLKRMGPMTETALAARIIAAQAIFGGLLVAIASF